MAILNLCPFLFYLTMVKSKRKLDEPKVKAKIGTLYNGLDAKKVSVISYSIVFLARRSLFVAITFALFG